MEVGIERDDAPVDLTSRTVKLMVQTLDLEKDMVVDDDPTSGNVSCLFESEELSTQGQHLAFFHIYNEAGDLVAVYPDRTEDGTAWDTFTIDLGPSK